MMCSIEGCTRRVKGRSNWCGKHLERMRRHGDPHKVIERPTWTGDAVSYNAMHQRLRKARGPVRGRKCVDCGGAAQQWSVARDLANKISPEGYPYSTDIEHYRPRCVSCHKRYDGE